MREDRFRVAKLNQLAQIHECGVLGNASSLLHAVTDDNDRVVFLEFVNQLFNAGGGNRVKRRARFVKQQYLRLHGDAASNAQTLLLAAGERGAGLSELILHIVPERRLAQRPFNALIQIGFGDALVNLNADEAAKVMAEDHVINSWEAELDDYLETIISRRQPQAVDLRLLLGYYRMTTDFERMGDEIRNAAKGVRKLSELVKPLSEPALANVSTLFSLHALLRVMGDDMIACVRLLDPERARALVARRTIVSAEVDEALSDTVERLKTGELKLADGLEFIRINRSLERVAAHMQNVGETVVFMTEGVDIRHAGKTQPQQN